MKHLVFYDGSCGLCDHAVQFLLKHDPEKLFAFAPLQGKTADSFLQGISRDDSLVLIENFQTEGKKRYLFGRGAFRILWLLGGVWRLIGWLSFFPPVLYNWGYGLIAKNRHRLFGNTCLIPDPSQKERFFP